MRTLSLSHWLTVEEMEKIGEEIASQEEETTVKYPTIDEEPLSENIERAIKIIHNKAGNNVKFEPVDIKVK